AQATRMNTNKVVPQVPTFLITSLFMAERCPNPRAQNKTSSCHCTRAHTVDSDRADLPQAQARLHRPGRRRHLAVLRLRQPAAEGAGADQAAAYADADGLLHHRPTLSELSAAYEHADRPGRRLGWRPFPDG